MPAFCLLAFLLVCLPDVRLSAQDEPLRRSFVSSTESNVAYNAQKLYESVLGYFQGFHQRPGQIEKKPIAGSKKWSGPSKTVIEDDSAIRTAEIDENLALARMDRNEWDLAIPALERALKAPSRLVSADDAVRLNDMLQKARVKAQNSGQEAPLSPGEITNSIGMRLVTIRPGAFVMGSTPAETRRIQAEWNVPETMLQVESPAHNVQISKPFLMGKYDVTVGQFKRFAAETGYKTVAEKQGWGWVYDENKKHWSKKMGASWNDPGNQISEDHPVSLICHADAEAFCEWLSKKDNRRYYLPTEAQWEYAARGGKEGERFSWGNDYPDGKKLNMADRYSPVPWADRTMADGYARLSPVGSFEPNAFWLYDMLGNVWQMCSDYYDPKAYEAEKSGAKIDPTGPRTGKKRVVRGGNWAFEAGIARNAFRFGIEPDLCMDITGFRVAADPTFRDKSPTEATEDFTNTEQILRLIEKVKELVIQGRRLEAHKLVRKLDQRGSKPKLLLDNPDFFAKNVLDTLIDVSVDHSVESFTNSLGMKMVRIPAGGFVMGSSEADIAWAMATLAQGQPVNLENEYPFHKVRISRPFFICATEVTVGWFRKFVEETGYITDAEDEKGGQVFNTQRGRFESKPGSSWKNPGWPISDDQPVVMISYNDAQAFCEWLTAKEKLPYKLPTEAQWEYAARGGLPMAQFPWGDALPDGRRANYADKNTDFEWRDRNSDDGYKYVAPVGSYEPNGYGLYDMAGNALEWVRDYYSEDYYRFAPEVDPEGPGHGENRVMKGGEWTFGAVNLRCAFRGWARPDLGVDNGGFRVAIEPANALRTFHFAEDFLTKEWVPGPDQRTVALAIAKQKERRPATSRVQESKVQAQEPQTDVTIKGVLVLSLTPKSDARRAGITQGDIIVEYDGVRDLTTEKFIALTAKTRKSKTKHLVVFVRNGYEHSVRISPGFVGVSVMDTNIRGPLKQPGIRPETEPKDDKEKRSKGLNWT
ncbi:MAG: SUMF1/EgtB/PvdO family nonheme iron enzyme [Desulfomonilaceae bacterium]